MSESPPLIVFSDDWGRHPSSCQHLISKLLARRRVTWVNTIGTRPPGLNWNTVTRGVGKVRQWVLPKRSAPHPPGPLARRGGEKERGLLPPPPLPVERGPGGEGLTVLNPKMWPSFRSHFGRGLNRRLLTRALAPVAAAMPAPPVVITTLPLVADLVGRFRAARWVYYCVDDFSVWPGLDGRTMQSMEAELVPKVDVAVAVSETLQTHLTKLGKPSHLLTHGVDLDFWNTADSFDDSIPARESELREFGKPLIVYWGVIDRRTDLAFVKALSDAMPDGTILFVGPQDDPDPGLARLPRVRTLPPLPFADLPALAARASVLIAPYADLPVTRAMQPLKLKEYIATGKPVVVRKLPATVEWADCVDVVDTPEAFAQAALVRLRDGVPEAQKQARARLEGEGWSAKAAQFEKWVDGVG